jgi:hypothetical protein
MTGSPAGLDPIAVDILVHLRRMRNFVDRVGAQRFHAPAIGTAVDVSHTTRKMASDTVGCALFRPVSKHGGTYKCLYLRLKSASVSLFHGCGGMGDVILASIADAQFQTPAAATPAEQAFA